MIKVARTFVKATALSQDTYQHLWSGESPVFCLDQGTRLRRLYDGRRGLERKDRRTRCARRISLLFVRQDFEELLASISEPSKVGEVKASIVYRQLVSELGASEASLKYDKKSGDNYTSLLDEAGPGSFLELDEKITYEYDLTLPKGAYKLNIDCLTGWSRNSTVPKFELLHLFGKRSTRAATNAFGASIILRLESS